MARGSSGVLGGGRERGGGGLGEAQVIHPFRDPRTITAPLGPHREARHTLLSRGKSARPKPRRFIPQDKKRDNLNPSF